jgi:hypothetical protein
LRERLSDAFQMGFQGGGGDTEATINAIKDRLGEVIEQRVAEAVSDRVREAAREHLAEAVRQRVPEVVRSVVGERGSGARPMLGAGFGVGASGYNDGMMSMAESLREHIHDALRTRFVDAVREHIGEMIKDRVEDVMRERLGAAVRAALVEQKLLGGFDPEQLADSVRGRIASAIRERLTDAVRERLHEVHRDRLRDAIRSAIGDHSGGGEFAGFGTGMH